MAAAAELVGHDIRADEVEIKRRMAYVSPGLSYRAWGTVGRAIDFVRAASIRTGTRSAASACSCTSASHRSERIDTLSFGSRVKLATLLALSRDAELLLLDEPTAGPRSPWPGSAALRRAR